MAIILTDIHGCYKTLLELLKKCPQEDVRNRDIYCLGDMIDRGPRSKEVLEWAKNEGIKAVIGNHEDMLLANYNIQPNCSNYYHYRVWQDYNGGDTTIRSFHGKPPIDILNWIKALPLYLIDPRYPELILSHTGNGENTTRFNALWQANNAFRTDRFYVFGHVRCIEPIITTNTINIDTGAVYPTYNTMTALLWPSKEIIQQKFVD